MSNSDNPDSFAGNMKRCSKCKIDKSRSEFYKDCSTKDGLQGWCKSCRAEHQQTEKGKASQQKSDRKRYLGNKEKLLQDSKDYKETKAGKESQRKSDRIRCLAHPEKRKAIQVVNSAIRAGKFHRPDFCESCFQENFVQGHHPDYDKPLEVDWLCPECHRKLHKELLLV